MQGIMQYDLIPSQCQGHEPLKIENPSIINSYLLRHLRWELATDHWFLNYGAVSKFDRTGFLGRLFDIVDKST